MSIVARLRSGIRPVLLSGVLLALLAPAAAAASAPHLAGQISDQTGVIGSGRAQVQSALDDLLSRENVQLWLVLIPTTDGATAQDLAQQTYQANGLGGNDMVLLIAVDDHRYGWWETTATGLPGPQVDSLLSSEMELGFRAGDYAGGMKGRGHSTWEVGVATAKAAGAKRLVLFHHDPRYDDAAMARILRDARRSFRRVSLAVEGTTLTA